MTCDTLSRATRARLGEDTCAKRRSSSEDHYECQAHLQTMGVGILCDEQGLFMIIFWATNFCPLTLRHQFRQHTVYHRKTILWVLDFDKHRLTLAVIKDGYAPTEYGGVPNANANLHVCRVLYSDGNLSMQIALC